MVDSMPFMLCYILYTPVVCLVDTYPCIFVYVHIVSGIYSPRVWCIPIMCFYTPTMCLCTLKLVLLFMPMSCLVHTHHVSGVHLLCVSCPPCVQCTLIIVILCVYADSVSGTHPPCVVLHTFHVFCIHHLHKCFTYPPCILHTPFTQMFT